MSTAKLSPLSAYELTPQHFDDASLGEWIDCFFPPGYGNSEAREAFTDRLGGDWGKQDDLEASQVCDLWCSLLGKEDYKCTSPS